MKSEKISELTTNRLSVYLRCLTELESEGRRFISSGALAARYNLTSAKIRKDIGTFGAFGVRGLGYDVKALRSHLTKILGLDRIYRVCIVGSGRIGTALADYYSLTSQNFKVSALFDVDRRKVGKTAGEIEIHDTKYFAEIVKRDKIEVAIIAVPAEAAKSALDLVVASGIRAVMNLAPVPLTVASNVKLKTVDLTTSLESLSYFLSRSANGRKVKPTSGSVRK
ncbi:MAG TPA: redox-sensing transcriptional repressor Rex [Pyrinomonadaceae bacterium]|nr:redox-sensing transcriptional repressor Rex [Pyrinomonadaceae bacterium]